MSSDASTARWLTEEERQAIIVINEADRALKAKESFSGSQIKSAFTDWRVYLWGLMYLTTYIPVYSVVLSLPTVVTGLGYKGTTATLMSVPPYGKFLDALVRREVLKQALPRPRIHHRSCRWLDNRQIRTETGTLPSRHNCHQRCLDRLDDYDESRRKIHHVLLRHVHVRHRIGLSPVIC